jgi:hypothetical protein
MSDGIDADPRYFAAGKGSAEKTARVRNGRPSWTTFELASGKKRMTSHFGF